MQRQWNELSKKCMPEIGVPIEFSTEDESYMGIMNKVGNRYYFMAEAGSDHGLIFKAENVTHWAPKMLPPSKMAEKNTFDNSAITETDNKDVKPAVEKTEVETEEERRNRILLEQLHDVRAQLEEGGWTLAKDKNMPNEKDGEVLLYCFIPNKKNPIKSVYVPAVGSADKNGNVVPRGFSKIKNAVIGWRPVPADDETWHDFKSEPFTERNGFVVANVTMFGDSDPEPWQCQKAIARMKKGKIVIHGFPEDKTSVVSWTEVPGEPSINRK